MILKPCQIYSCYPYDDHFSPSLCALPTTVDIILLTCHSNTTNYLTQGIYLVQIRGNVHTRSAYPFVNLSVWHFSVIHKTNSSCTNLESKKRKKKNCLNLWKTLLYFIFCQVVFLGSMHIRRRICLLTAIVQFYFAFLFCFQIEFQC